MLECFYEWWHVSLIVAGVGTTLILQRVFMYVIEAWYTLVFMALAAPCKLKVGREALV
jgi:hypothetical protein